MGRTWMHLLLTGMLASPLSIVACSDEADTDEGERSCGDGACTPDDCETVVRCPEDCGTCVGTECQVGGTAGSCGESCDSSCDCLNQNELCTRDYGLEPGTCIPAECLGCSTFANCSYAPNADGKCESASCS
jgi:hypothetical protein